MKSIKVYNVDCSVFAVGSAADRRSVCSSPCTGQEVSGTELLAAACGLHP